VADGTIEVVAAHSPSAYVYALVKPRIEIDDRETKLPWGTHSFPVAPGTHTVAVSYPWLLKSHCGRNEVEVEVGSEETIRVTYEAGLIRYVPGKMATEKMPSTQP